MGVRVVISRRWTRVTESRFNRESGIDVIVSTVHIAICGEKYYVSSDVYNLLVMSLSLHSKMVHTKNEKGPSKSLSRH